ncbi:MAG: helix-turn-helix domain-containing protein [Clostridiales bacterium]|nr:helix-turn-helix domain-containing protein [Clostridiales bacterium]
MKLTAEIVLEYLEKKMKVSPGGDLCGLPALGRPFLYEKGKTLRPRHFYVAEDRDIRTIDFFGEDVCLILLCTSNMEKGGDAPDAPSAETIKEDEGFPCIYVETEESIGWVLNEVQDIFDRLEDWKEKLEFLSSGKGTLEEMLMISTLVFLNPISVIGVDFRLKAQAGGEDMPPEAHIFSIDDAANMEYINALKQDEQFNEMQSAREAVLYPEYITGYRSYNMNLWNGNECRYRLVLVEFHKKLTPGDGYLLEFMAPYVQRMIAREGKTEKKETHSLRRLFQRILTDPTADYIEVSQQLSSFGWKQEHSYLCLIFQVTYLDQQNLTMNAICSYMEDTIPGASSFSYREEIVTFFDLDLVGMELEDLEGKLKYFIRESFLKAGYSWVMEGHGNLRRQYVQADLALDVGGRVKPYLWIHHFQDVAFSYILEQSARRLPGYMLCHEKLRRLQKSDERQGTEYMKTLKVYLDEHMNAMQSAKKLFIHRSTFLYRLDKIKALLESDLDDPEEVLYLSFSFRLLEKENSKTD